MSEPYDYRKHEGPLRAGKRQVHLIPRKSYWEEPMSLEQTQVMVAGSGLLGFAFGALWCVTTAPPSIRFTDTFPMLQASLRLVAKTSIAGAAMGASFFLGEYYLRQQRGGNFDPNNYSIASIPTGAVVALMTKSPSRGFKTAIGFALVSQVLFRASYSPEYINFAWQRVERIDKQNRYMHAVEELGLVPQGPYKRRIPHTDPYAEKLYGNWGTDEAMKEMCGEGQPRRSGLPVLKENH